MSHRSSSSTSSSSSSSGHGTGGGLFGGSLRPWGMSSGSMTASAQSHSDEITHPRIIRPNAMTTNATLNMIPLSNDSPAVLSRIHHQQNQMQRLSLKSMVPSAVLRPLTSTADAVTQLRPEASTHHQPQYHQHQQDQYGESTETAANAIANPDPPSYGQTLSNSNYQLDLNIPSGLLTTSDSNISPSPWNNQATTLSTSTSSEETIKGHLLSATLGASDTMSKRSLGHASLRSHHSIEAGISSTISVDPLSGIGSNVGKWSSRNRFSLPHSSSSDAWELASPTIPENEEYVSASRTSSPGVVMNDDPLSAPSSQHRRLRNSWHSSQHSPSATGGNTFLQPLSPNAHVYAHESKSLPRRLSSNLSISTSAILDQLEESITSISLQPNSSTLSMTSTTAPASAFQQPLNPASTVNSASLGRSHRDSWKMSQYTNALSAPPARPVSLDVAALWDTDSNTLHSRSTEKRFSVPAQFESIPAHTSRHSWQMQQNQSLQHTEGHNGRTISEDSFFGNISNSGMNGSSLVLMNNQSDPDVMGSYGASASSLGRPGSAASTTSVRLTMGGGRVTPQQQYGPGLSSPLTPGSWTASPQGQGSHYFSYNREREWDRHGHTLSQQSHLSQTNSELDWYREQQLLTPPESNSFQHSNASRSSGFGDDDYSSLDRQQRSSAAMMSSHQQNLSYYGNVSGRQQGQRLRVDTSGNSSQTCQSHADYQNSHHSRPRLVSPTITVPKYSPSFEGTPINGKNVTLVGERLFTKQLEQMNRSMKQSHIRSASSTLVPSSNSYSNSNQIRRKPNLVGSTSNRSGRTSNSDPIGLFVWGFPEQVGVKEIIQEFSSFGRIMNVGIDRTVTEERYALVDFEDAASVRNAMDHMTNIAFFGMTSSLSFRLRYEKGSTFESKSVAPKGDRDLIPGPPRQSTDMDVDYRMLVLTNCPHNMNKPKLESVFARIGEIKRVKVVQRSSEKRASAVLVFRNPDQARKAVLMIQRATGPLFRDMNEKLEFEYPVQNVGKYLGGTSTSNAPNRLSGDMSRLDVQASNNGWRKNTELNQSFNHDGRSRIGTKKAKKAAAAENRIVYIRELKRELASRDTLEATFSAIGRFESFVIISKASAPDILSAFIVFPQPLMASNAVAAKTGGCTLPRHKRVDLPGVPLDVSEADVVSFFKQAGEIKQVILPHAYAEMVQDALGVNTIDLNARTGTCMIEYVTSMGAAKAIVLARQVVTPFMTELIFSDYSPSLKPPGLEDAQPTIGSTNLREDCLDAPMSHDLSTHIICTKSARDDVSSSDSDLTKAGSDDEEVHVVVEEDIVVEETDIICSDEEASPPS